MSNDEKIKSQMELIAELAELVSQLGWVIALPNEEKPEGLIIGKPDYVVGVVNAYYGSENIEILEQDPESGFESQSFDETETKQEESVEILDVEKKKTYH